MTSIADLVAYLDREVPDLELELFVCWEGSQEESPTGRLHLTRGELATRPEWCDELVFSQVARAT